MGRFKIKGSDDKLRNTHLRGIEEPFFINADLGRQRVKTVHPQSLISPESLVMIASPGFAVVMKTGHRNFTKQLLDTVTSAKTRLLAKNEGI